jgi:cellulose synthase operon protein C
LWLFGNTVSILGNAQLPFRPNPHMACVLLRGSFKSFAGQAFLACGIWQTGMPAPRQFRGSTLKMLHSIRLAIGFVMFAAALAISAGSVAFAQQKPAKATAAVKQAYAAAAAFQNEGIIELAADDWEEFLKQFGDDPLAADARFNLGACYFKLGKYDKAADAFAIVSDKHPKFDLSETNLLNLGIASFKAAQAAGNNKDRFNQAAGALDRYLKQYPRSKAVSQALVLRAQALAAAGRQQEAAASWLDLIERNPTLPQSAETLYAVGMGLLENNQSAPARKVFDRLAREHGEHRLAAVALFELGEYEYHRRKDYAAAEKAYLAASSAAKDAALVEKIDYKLGWTYYQQRDFSRAEQVFASLLQQVPVGKLAGDTELMLGECEFKQNKVEAAYPHFCSALRGKLSSAGLSELALLRAGQCAAQLKRWDESLKLLDRFGREFTTSSHQDEAAIQRADVLKNLGRLDESLQQLRIVAEQATSPFAMQAQFAIGRLQSEAGNHRDAVRSFYKVIHGFGDAKSPSTQNDFKAIAIFEAARSFEALQNYDQARRLYSAFIERYPSNENVTAARQRLDALKRLP